MSDLIKINSDFNEKINSIKSKEELQNLKTEFFGKNGLITSQFKKLGSLSSEEKKEFDIELKNSKGKEVKIQIKKTDDNIENNEIRPFNMNDETKTKKRWDIGATYFEREIDPFVESLINQYNVPLKDTKKNVR